MGFNSYDDEDVEGSNVNVVDSDDPSRKVKVTGIGEAQASDILNNQGTQGALTVGTTAVEVKVNTQRLADRKSVTVYNNNNKNIFWGWDSSVTALTGTPIPRGALQTFRVGDNITVYLVAENAGNDVRITEAY